MSTVCYCGQPDCPVTTWERDACVANLRAERDALKAQVLAVHDALHRECDGTVDLPREIRALRAQVEAARRQCEKRLKGSYATLSQATARQILDAMDEAAKGGSCDCRHGCVKCNPWLW